MPALSRFVAVGGPSDASLLERCEQRARPASGRYQRTLLTRKCEGRQNADAAILLSTQGTPHILCLLITNLGKAVS